MPSSNGANINFNQNVAGSFNYPISGNGSLAMTGNSVLTLTGSNSYTGATILSGGSLEFNSSSNQVLSGGLAGSSTLIQQGPGTLTLSGTSNFNGLVYLNGGVLSVAALNDTSSSNLGTGPLTLTAGTLQYTGTGDTTGRSVTASNDNTIQVTNPAADLTFTGAVGGNNNLDLTKTGSGTLTLNVPGDNGGLFVAVAQGTVVLAHQSGGGHTVSQIYNVSPGATVQLGPGGSGGRNLFGCQQHERHLRFQRL